MTIIKIILSVDVAFSNDGMTFSKMTFRITTFIVNIKYQHNYTYNIKFNDS